MDDLMFENGILVQTGTERDVMVESGIMHEPADETANPRFGDMNFMGF